MDNIRGFCSADKEFVRIINFRLVENGGHSAISGTCEKCGMPIYKVLSPPARETHDTQ